MAAVLVAGAGPTGLTAALLLADAGVDVRIVDAAPERSDKSRALAVQARTLELLDRFGLAEALLAVGEAAKGTNLYADGERAVRAAFGPHMPEDTRFGVMLFVSQVEVERQLEAALAARGVRVERPVALRAFAELDEGVQAVLDGPDGEERVRCRYLVGADGAHSTVRHQLDIDFEGEAYRADFMLADAVIDTEFPTDELQVFLGRRGLCVFFPLPGARTRLIVTEPAVEGELTLERLAATAAEHAGRPLPLSDCDWLARFRLHHRGAQRFRLGRAFIAGDAAHIHSPIGGQGMNTGMQDAWNLAWKLVAVLRDGAPDRLLDSYEAERQPVAVKLLAVTDRAFQAAAADARWFTGARNLLLPWLAPHAASPERMRKALRFVSQLGIRYRHSPLNGPTDGGAGPAPGERVAEVPHAERWRLLAWGGDAWFRAQVAQLGTLLHWVQPAFVDPRHGVDTGLALVRPDGHLAMRAAGVGVDAVYAYFRGIGLGP